jgi:hypothetical protein
MRFLLVALLLAVLALVFFAYPLFVEDSNDVCGAFEQRIAGLASHDRSGLLTVSPLYNSTSSRPSAAAYVRDHYPLLPQDAGCAFAYWKSLVVPPEMTPTAGAPAAAGAEPASSEPLPATTTPPSSAIISTIARDITPNGDPISPATVFTLPMNTVAVRVDYAGGRPGAARFQLLQGRAVLSSCNADRGAPGTAWCRFGVGLRKGNYAISFIANNVILGQFPFTVIGR